MTKRVLMVEDEPKNMKLLRDLLGKFGYETIEAIDGEQGVELARKIRPDLILRWALLVGQDRGQIKVVICCPRGT